MKVKEVIKLAAFYLQLEGVISRGELADSYNGGIIDDGTPEAAALDRLLRCCNLVYGEIASEYYPPEAAQVFTTSDGVIQNGSFAKSLIDVKRVEDADGRALKFKAYSSHIKTESGKVTVRYTYLPASLSLGGALEFGDKISARVIAYGAASEYCVISAMFDEALMWEKRFRDSLAAAVRKKSEIRIPARKWR